VKSIDTWHETEMQTFSTESRRTRADRPGTRDWGDVAVVVSGIYLVVVLLHLFWPRGSEALQLAIANLFNIPLFLVAAVLLWRASRQPDTDPRAARGWRWLALACLAIAAGDLIWAYYELVLDVVPSISWADPPYLLYYPLVLGGLLAFPRAPRSGTDALKFWLDVLVVMLAGTIVVWYLILEPIVHEAGASSLLKAVSLSYPVGDLIVLYGITALVLRDPEAPSRPALYCLVAGLSAALLGDLSYAYANISGNYQSGFPVDALWGTEAFLFAVAVQHHRRASRQSSSEPGEARPASLEASHMPYAAIVLACALLLWIARDYWLTSLSVMLVTAVVLIALVVARQIVAQREIEAMAAAQIAREEKLREAQKMEAIGRLAGGVAHDFNNQLTAILGFARLLEMERGTGDTKLYLGEIIRAAERSATLTHQLLAYSRRQILQPEVIQINRVIERIDLLLRKLISPDIELRLMLGPDTGHIEADPAQLEQAVINLALNARDAMAGGGTLSIRTEARRITVPLESTMGTIPPGSYAVLTMTDSGHGIEEALLERIFEPFFTTKEQGKGTGLGLSMALGVVDQSGGYMTVRSGVGRGTTFEVLLPHVSEPQPEAPARYPGAVVRGQGTVLLVEDEPSVRTLTGRLLRRSGFEVIEAEDGEAALELWTRHADVIDVVLTDLSMPRLGGRELVRALREKQISVPAIFMTGHMHHLPELDATVDMPYYVFDEGPLILKPFEPTVLIATINKAIRADIVGRLAAPLAAS
jgi:signal transduction histidine kinase